MSKLTTQAERFWSKVEKTSTCWLWTAALESSGYGHYRVNGVSRKAHRYSYELLAGPIPEGMQIDHLCRVRRCVNPAHLEPVTSQENSRRGEGPAGRFGRRTHCDNGHPLEGHNLIVSVDRGVKTPRRRCRTCVRERAAEYRRRRKAV